MPPIDPASAAPVVGTAIATTGAVVKGSKALGWAGKKLLGPLFDEIGTGFAERYAERRKRNIERMLENAAAKGRAGLEAGHQVSPRVVSQVIGQGSWAEGPLMAEYFGGIWAASLSPGGDDDRGVVWAGIVARLAAVDVLLHYTFYEAFRRIYLGRDLELGFAEVQEQSGVYLPCRGPWVSPFAKDDDDDGVDVGTSAVALEREGLIRLLVAGGSREHVSDSSRIDAPYDGLVLTPSVPGIELFLWAHGARRSFGDFLDIDQSLEPFDDIARCEDARGLAVMQAERQERVRQEQHAGSVDERSGP